MFVQNIRGGNPSMMRIFWKPSTVNYYKQPGAQISHAFETLAILFLLPQHSRPIPWATTGILRCMAMVISISGPPSMVTLSVICPPENSNEAFFQAYVAAGNRSMQDETEKITGATYDNS